MKANRKFIEGDQRAVSAVIGVILMVAITVAIAATVYVYVSGMLGGTQNKAPSMAFNKQTTPARGLTLVSADSGLKWSDFTLTQNTSTTLTAPATNVLAGQFIALTPATNTRGTITIVYTPTNTLMGTWTWP
jgi:flagellin-like protein